MNPNAAIAQGIGTHSSPYNNPGKQLISDLERLVERSNILSQALYEDAGGWRQLAGEIREIGDDRFKFTALVAIAENFARAPIDTLADILDVERSFIAIANTIDDVDLRAGVTRKLVEGVMQNLWHWKARNPALHLEHMDDVIDVEHRLRNTVDDKDMHIRLTKLCTEQAVALHNDPELLRRVLVTQNARQWGRKPLVMPVFINNKQRKHFHKEVKKCIAHHKKVLMQRDQYLAWRMEEYVEKIETEHKVLLLLERASAKHQERYAITGAKVVLIAHGAAGLAKTGGPDMLPSKDFKAHAVTLFRMHMRSDCRVKLHICGAGIGREFYGEEIRLISAIHNKTLGIDLAPRESLAYKLCREMVKKYHFKGTIVAYPGNVRNSPEYGLSFDNDGRRELCMRIQIQTDNGSELLVKRSDVSIIFHS